MHSSCVGEQRSLDKSYNFWPFLGLSNYFTKVDFDNKYF